MRIMLQRGFPPGRPSGLREQGKDFRKPLPHGQRPAQNDTSGIRSGGPETESDIFAPPIVSEVVNSPGQPLDALTRASMEQRFGHNFSRVKVHTDSRAAQSALALNAHAYTAGRSVVFGESQYKPETSVGWRLLGHELAHVVQQGAADAPKQPALVLPPGHASEAEAQAAATKLAAGGTLFRLTVSQPVIARQARSGRELAPNPYDEMIEQERRAREFRVMTLSIVKDPILEALHRSDHILMMSRIRAVSAEDRELLQNDRDFMQQLEQGLTGSPSTLWIARRILQFGTNTPDFVRKFEDAIRSQDFAGALRLLRIFPQLKNETLVPGLHSWVQSQVQAVPGFAMVLQEMEIAEPEHRERPASSYTETHYEPDKTTQQYALKTFTGTERYALVRTANELRVIVRIRLVTADTPPTTYFPSNDLATRWINGINSIWNNKFRMINGKSQAESPNRLDIVFLPVFTETDPHHTVTVHPAGGTAHESEWYETDSGVTAAHEFGHMLGNPDEYHIPGSVAEIPHVGQFASLTPGERARTSVEGIYGRGRPAVPGGYSLPTIMGGSEEGPRPTTVELRHVQNIVSWYNANFKPPGEPSYRPVFR